MVNIAHEVPIIKPKITLKRPKFRKISRAYYIGLLLSILIAVAVFIETYHTAVYGIGAKSYISDEMYYAGEGAKFDIFLFGFNTHVPFIPTQLAPNYWNLEHPPLAKYIIALSIALFNNGKPISYRFPSILISALMPIITYLAFAYPFSEEKKVKRITAGLIASLIFPAEHIIAVEGALALLDVYATFFILIALAFAYHRKYLLSSLFIGFAVASKETAFPFILALVILYLVNEKANFKEKLTNTFIYFAMPILVFIFSYIPFFAFLGVKQTVEEALIFLHWDLVSRPSGPTPSTPIDWVIGRNSMYLSVIETYYKVGNNIVKTSASGLSASMTAPIEIVSFVLVMYIFISYIIARIRFKAKIDLDPAVIFYVVEFVSFYAVYLIGNHTLYSMYAIIFVPMTAFVYGNFIYTILMHVKIKVRGTSK